jgi:hypothetical protein
LNVFEWTTNICKNFKPDFLYNFQTTPHLHFLMNSENKSLLIFKSLKQDIDVWKFKW